MKAVLAAALAAQLGVARAQNMGSGSCPCVSTRPAGAQADGSYAVTIGSQTLTYPSNYGTNGCQAYDSTLSANGCADASGVPLADAPAWCGDEWCYVDKNNCEVAGGAVSSTFFANTYYSIQTCYVDTGASVQSYSEETSAGVAETTAIVENYLQSISDAVENAYEQTSSTSQRCDYAGACPCQRCEDDGPLGPWHCSSDGGVNLQSTNIFFRSPEGRKDDGPSRAETEGEAADKMKCMSMAASHEFLRVAGKEHQEERIGFMMFGGQDTGAMLNWPATQWCSETYDPRFRPWYSGTASGPKDVVMIIDISGSMSAGSRIEMAQEAAKNVVRTLTWSDHASIVLFDDRTIEYEPDDGSHGLAAVTPDEAELMNEFIMDNIKPSGGTNFDAAFETAFDLISTTSQTSACNRVMLFMTDGQATLNYNVRAQARAHGVRVMTYALGSGAETTVCRNIACETGGVFTAVPDNGDLNLAMASYYKVLAAGMPAEERNKISWSNYHGAFTPVEFMSACKPAFKPDVGGAGNFADLLGVTCMDLNVLANLPDLREEGDWSTFYQTKLIDEACYCPAGFSLNHDQLEAIRASMGAISGAQTCGAGAAMDDNQPRTNVGQSTCGSGIEEDEGDYKCGIKPQWLAVLWIFVIIVVVGIVVVVHGAKETCGRGGNTVRNVAQAPQAINVNVQMQPSAPPAHAPAAHMMQMPPAYAQPKGPVMAVAVPVERQGP